MTRAIAKSNFTIALFAFAACGGPSAPPVVDVPAAVTISDASAPVAPITMDASSAEIAASDAGAVISEPDDAGSFENVGDNARHEKVKVPLYGLYYLTTDVDPKVTVTSHGVSRVAMTSPPLRSRFFLDGSYTDWSLTRGACILRCLPATTATIDLVEYVEEGKRMSPDQPPFPKGMMLSSYRTTDLVGQIKLELDTFADKKCRVPKNFKKRIVRSPPSK